MRHVLTFACFVLAVATLAEGRAARSVSRRRRNTALINVPVTSASSPDIYVVSPVLRRLIRSAGDACEKKELCLLHSNRNAVSAFELYFVSKDNARLWDHDSHTHNDCEKMFPGCGESASDEESASSHQKHASVQAAPAANQVAKFRGEDYGNDDDDDDGDDY